MRSSWASFLEALRSLARSPAEAAAVVLTHAHFDHIGFAEKARRARDISVWVHENDVPPTRHPHQYAREQSPLRSMATQVQAMPIVASLLRSGAFWPAPIAEVRRFSDGDLDVPGSPRVVFTPGHALGHCALHFADRNVVIAGDALVMLDPYTGKPGPRLVARVATADTAWAFDSLDPLAKTGADTVLTGHGPAWKGGVESAVGKARAAGAA